MTPLDTLAQQREHTRNLVADDGTIDNQWAGIVVELMRAGWSAADAGAEADRRMAARAAEHARAASPRGSLQRWLLAASVLAIIVIITILV